MDPKDRVETVVKTKAGAREEKASSGEERAPGAALTVPQADVDAIIESWPAAPRKVVEETIKKYGLPNEATPTLLIWHDSGPWKRTIITSDETAHDFPTPHTDYISQTINYDVPVEKLPELAEFDGSLIVYRTAGQVTASCDNEPANLLAVNLMHEIVEGRLTAEGARKEFGVDDEPGSAVHGARPVRSAVGVGNRLSGRAGDEGRDRAPDGGEGEGHARDGRRQ